jgi:hypothetical protein
MYTEKEELKGKGIDNTFNEITEQNFPILRKRGVSRYRRVS